MGTLEKRDILCHKYLEKGLCFALFPACTNVSSSTQGDYRSESVVSPCRDLCEEFEISCSKKLGQAFIDTLYCDYFRYKEHIDICYHQDVFCEEPDLIPNGGYNIIGGNSSFAAGTTIDYYCDRNYELDGLQNSTCLFSGGWSSTSKCTTNHSNLTLKESLLFIGIPCVIVSAILVFVFFSFKRRTFKKKLTTKPLEKRNRKYDAFVSYYSDDSSPDQSLVKNILCTKLENEQEDPFKLVVHERDFSAGTNIVTNIMNAIKNSNSAIILLSQDYVNSRWCRDEFEWCVEERKKDPAYELYVILMESDRKLEGLSDYMEQYLHTITYLKLTDHKLLGKIVDELSKIKTDQFAEKYETTPL